MLKCEFWDAFKKRAMDATKGVRSGLQTGAHPRSNTAVAAAFKPNKLPTPTLNAAPNKNLSPTLPPKAPGTMPGQPKHQGHGVGSMVI